jgi:N-acetylglucosaminyl-diphospho-decaprenol L-rhamnosyltransferase
MPPVEVAVVIVTYKSAQLTINSLRSLEAERAAPGTTIRAVVVDNASGDASAIGEAVAARGWASWVRLLSAPRNGGFAYGNNLGIEAAYQRGRVDYVYLLNPDTEVRSGAIGALVRFLEAHTEAGIAGSSFENRDGSVARQMSRTPEPVDWISGASMLIRPAVLQAIGGLDENYFLYFEETDFCFRAKRAGFQTWYVPESRVMHIAGQSTTVTDRSRGPERLPPYWFESRRRYFALTHGVPRAIAIDVVALVANLLGSLKRIALGRTRSAVPYFVRDLIRYSVLWPRHRVFPAPRCDLPIVARSAISGRAENSVSHSALRRPGFQTPLPRSRHRNQET